MEDLQLMIVKKKKTMRKSPFIVVPFVIIILKDQIVIIPGKLKNMGYEMKRY
jgi:hypothetical protein